MRFLSPCESCDWFKSLQGGRPNSSYAPLSDIPVRPFPRLHSHLVLHSAMKHFQMSMPLLFYCARSTVTCRTVQIFTIKMPCRCPWHLQKIRDITLPSELGEDDISYFCNARFASDGILYLDYNSPASDNVPACAYQSGIWTSEIVIAS